MKKRRPVVYYLFVLAIFLCLAGPNLFSDGMFLDGLIYAAISKNMAHGLGSFWAPYLSDGLFPVFYEHPPLALGLQSIWFKIFGDSILVERFYSLTTCIVTGGLIVLVWKEITKNSKTGWIPLLFWVSVSTVPWACTNNILENTMGVFVCLSAWLYLKSYKRNSLLFIVLSGVALSLAVLTKGLVALYIWTFPFFYWLFFRKENFLKMFLRSLLLIGITALPLVLFYLLSEDANNYFTHYINQQVIWNSQNQVTVNSRFAILGGFLQSVLPPLLIAILFIGLAYKKKIPLQLLKKNQRTAWFYCCIILSGVLPIMISLKQSSFYILTVFPFFAIALGYFLLPVLEKLIDLIERKTNGFKTFTVITFCLVTISLSITLLRVHKIGRDKNKISDCYAVIDRIGTHQSINICPGMFTDWSLHGYYARYGNISLIPDSIAIYKFYLRDRSCDTTDLHTYSELDLKLKEYKLFSRN